MHVPKSAEVTKFASEPANTQLLELSHEEYSVCMPNIFKEIKEYAMGEMEHNENVLNQR